MHHWLEVHHGNICSSSSSIYSLQIFAGTQQRSCTEPGSLQMATADRGLQVSHDQSDGIKLPAAFEKGECQEYEGQVE